jgi:hypothetical protein
MIETFYNWDGPTVLGCIATVIFAWSVIDSWRARLKHQAVAVRLANAAQAIACCALPREPGYIAIPKQNMEELIDALLDFRCEAER